MKSEKFPLIRPDEKPIRATMYSREYIIKALDVYKWNNRVSRSEIVNKLLEDFLIRTGYMNDKGEVLRERVF
jgi:hypothetical protein